MAAFAIPLMFVLTTACTGGDAAGREEESAVETASRSGQPEDPASIVLSQEEMAAGGITVATPRVDRRSSQLSASALLQLDETRTARIGAVVDGVVVDIPVQIGARVAKGARLAGMHSHELHEARAEYRRALAERRRATTELAFLRDAEARVGRLLAAKAASSQELERARTERMAAEEALVIAESEVQRALEGLHHLGIPPEPETPDASDAIPVTATLSGVVLERLVTPGSAVTVGTPLFVVSDLSRLWAIAEVDESLLKYLTLGDAAEVTVAAYPERAFSGRVIAIGDTVNPETRRVTVRIAVPNDDGSLKPQMFSTVRLSSGPQQQALLVPAAAVQKLDQQPVLFVEEAPGRFVRRDVTLGEEREGFVQIVSGLSADERVAVSGTFLIKSKVVETGIPE